MNTQQNAHTAEQNIYLPNQLNHLQRIPERKKYNSSIVTAGLSIGVDPAIIEFYMPQMLEATKQLHEARKNNHNQK